MKSTLTIALLGKEFDWSGGVDFVRNVANALLSQAQSHNLKIYLLLPVENRVDTATDVISIGKAFLIDAILNRKIYSFAHKELFHPSFINAFKNLDGNVVIHFYNHSTQGLTNALRAIQADVVMPALSSLGDSFPFPWIGYVFDFQHKYYSQYFTPAECLSRDILFATILRDAKGVIVNARSVNEDINRLYPYHACRIFDLPFAPTPVEQWLTEPSQDMTQKYSLPKEFFIISNQFWIHKSHATAFEALSIVLKSDPTLDVHVVCTGNTFDDRCPQYYEDLLRIIASLGLTEKVHILGFIPKEDQAQIMRKSIALLQPTLFEGGPGGGAVYDAVSLGVPAIVSDISVNKEITADNVFFFKAGSASDMASKMVEVLDTRPCRRELHMLLTEGEKRKRQLGERLLEAIWYVTGRN